MDDSEKKLNDVQQSKKPLPVKLFKQIFGILYVSLFASCNSSNPTAYFFISNISDTKKAVDIKITMDTNAIFDGIIKYSNIAPDLQYTPYVTLPRA